MLRFFFLISHLGSVVCRMCGLYGHIWMLRLVLLFVYFRRVWNLRGKMFGFHFRLCLSPRARIHVVSRLQKAHKYASLKKISDVPPAKVQSLLYPFSELHPYLDRYWTLYYHVISCQILIRIWTVSRSFDATQFQLFHPSLEDMIKAEKLFYSSPSHKIDYHTSAVRMDHVPALNQPEVGETAVSF